MRKFKVLVWFPVFLLAIITASSLARGENLSLKGVPAQDLKVARVIETNIPPEAIWSPDGKRYVCIQGKRENIKSLVLGTRGVKGLKKIYSASKLWKVLWSPDGTKIMFPTRNYNRYGQIVCYDLSKGTVKVLVSGKGSVSYTRPSWSSDGRQIAYCERPVGKVRSFDIRICIANADGSSPRYLTNGVDPTWSPKGDKIAFTRSEKDPSTGRWTQFVWLINVDGTGERKLPTKDAGVPVWSPDGTRIGYVRGLALSVADVSGEKTIKVVDATTDLSPSPRRIAERKRKAQYDPKIGRVIPDTTGPASCEIRDFCWSPDGTKLAFSVYEIIGIDGEIMGLDIWVVNADGTGFSQLTDTDDIWEMKPNWPSPNEIFVTADIRGQAKTITMILELTTK